MLLYNVIACYRFGLRVVELVHAVLGEAEEVLVTGSLACYNFFVALVKTAPNDPCKPNCETHVFVCWVCICVLTCLR